jgi:hypothetical protein
MADDDYFKLIGFNPSLRQRMRHESSALPVPSSALPGTPAYDVNHHLEQVRALWRQYPLRTTEAIDTHLLETLAAVFKPRPPWMVSSAILAAVRTVYADNDVHMPREPFIPLQPHLRSLQLRLSSPVYVQKATSCVEDFLRSLIDLMPASAFEKERDLSQETWVPLYVLIPEPRRLITLVHHYFFSPEIGDDPVFPALRRTLRNNMVRASGFDPETFDWKRRITMPADFEGSDVKALETYLADTPFLALFADPVPFSIPDKAYREHGALFAPSGHGKTQALQSIIVSFLERPDPPAMFIIDGLGTMLDKIARLAVFDSRLKDRLIIIEPRDVPALNFFQMKGGSDAQQIELFTYLFTAIDQSLSTKMATGVRFIVQLMQAIPGATVQTMREIMEEPAKSVDGSKYAREIMSLDPLAQAYFRNQFFNPSAMKVTRESIASRLYTVLGNPTFNQMFSAPANVFDALSAMQERKIVLINTDRFYLGDDASAVFGRFFIAQCLAAALARAPIPPDERHLALLVVDEAKDYFDAKTEKILSDARQFGLGLLFATQFVEQLPEGVRKAMYNNTAIKMAGPITHNEAVTFAREARTTPEFLRSMISVDRRYTEIATYVRNYTPQAVKLTIPYGILEGRPRMSDEAYAALRQRNRERYSAFSPSNAKAPVATPPPVPAAPSLKWQTPE